jgi:hypothetical protein
LPTEKCRAKTTAFGVVTNLVPIHSGVTLTLKQSEARNGYDDDLEHVLTQNASANYTPSREENQAPSICDLSRPCGLPGNELDDWLQPNAEQLVKVDES